MLLTRRGAERLARAESVVYDGLVHPAILDLASPTCERIYAGKKHLGGGEPLTQEQINALLVKLGLAGRRVVRLKGGDPFVFGRGGEECRALAAAGVPFEIVPGVTAATAVPAYAGIPLTDREVASTVAFATGHEAAGKPESEIDWQALARGQTVVLFMALKTARECAERLIRAGRDPDTPAAAIYWGTTARQRTVVAPLRELGEVVARAGLVPPVLLVVGEVVAQREALSWFETSPLFGLRVAVTRRREQADEVCRRLAELGAEPIVLPVTRIAGASADEARAVGQALDQLATFDWLLFASAVGVGRFFDELAARGLDARVLAGVRVACVGDKTAEELGRRGVRADVVPSRADAVGAAEAIVAARGGSASGARVLVARASGGREEAVERLSAAGAAVATIELYRSEPAEPAGDPILRHELERLRAGDIDVVALFAPSQVRALFDLLGEDAADVLARCRAIAAIGETTRAALMSRGVHVDVVPRAATGPALAEALAAHLSQEAR
jgi:uroporphyrinogen III methyltransferase / synthase